MSTRSIYKPLEQGIFYSTAISFSSILIISLINNSENIISASSRLQRGCEEDETKTKKLMIISVVFDLKCCL